MGRHHQKPAPATSTPGREPSPRPRLHVPEILLDYCTWPMIALALAVVLVLGVLIGVVIS